MATAQAFGKEYKALESVAMRLPDFADVSDVERSVLGAILIDNDVQYQAYEVLAPEDFLLANHQLLFAAMLELSKTGTGIDIITLTEGLSRRKTLEAIGGVAYVSSLTDGLPRRENIAHYCGYVRDAAYRRALIHALHDGLGMCLDGSEKNSDVASVVESKLLELEARMMGRSRGPKKLSAVAVEVFEKINRKRSGKQNAQGLSYGLRSLDDATTGMQPGEYTVVGGRTGDGKSAYSLGVAICNGKDQTPVAIFTPEMSEEAVVGRSISSIATVNNFKIRDPRRLDAGDVEKLLGIRKQLEELPIWIDDSVQHVAQMISRARLLVRREKVQLVIVDYLQLVRSSERKKEERVSAVSAALRSFAKAEKVHVMALSQLRRPERDKKNQIPRPSLFDLKESGDVEQDAHTVLLIHRGRGQCEGEDEIIIAKQREGPTGTEKVFFHQDTLTFKARD